MRQFSVIIRGKDHPGIKQYCKLCTSKKYREETGLFAIETLKLVTDAVNAQVAIEKVFVTEHCLQQECAILPKLFDVAVSVVVIENRLESKMTQTKNAGGLFAICKKLDKHRFSDKIGTHGKYIYLHTLQDTGNIGTIIRTAEALGLSGVIFSNGTSDPYSLKVLRASMGSVFRLPLFYSADAVADISAYHRYFQTYAAVIAPDATDLQQVAFAENSILFIGNEGNGLPEDLVLACRHKITIGMAGQANSLNAGIAAGIFMWEQCKSILSANTAR